MSVRASRYIAWVLRHGANKADLPIDDAGWVVIEDLINSLRSRGYRVDEVTVQAIVANDEKGRYSISQNGQRIRANYGHSIAVALTAPPTTPPEVLYHGTARLSIDSIRRDGLLPGTRQYVHLSDEVAGALSVGSRHGRPVAIKIDSQTMHDDGMLFYAVGKHTWLTGQVPVRYLRLHELIF